MTRTFIHQFEPAEDSPFDGDAELTVKEIETAGLKEIIQCSGAKVSSWSILDTLLEPGHPRFIFREPLGLAREVKVAASGLFGRFVARAYLERHFGLSFFAHLGTKTISLDGAELEIRRKRNSPGDLPDWVACAPSLNQLTVAEAKGCHDTGTSARMRQAWRQVDRVDVLAKGKRLKLKRIAIVTRWASTVGGARHPIIHVRDPEEPGDPDTEHRCNDAGIGIARLHATNLLEPLGFGALANTIRILLKQPRVPRLRNDGRIRDAQGALASIRPRTIHGQTQGQPLDSEGMIGAFITRAGPLGMELSTNTAQNLRGLGLRPMFVGMERRVLQAIIEGNPNKLKNETRRERVTQDPDLIADSAGTCFVNVGERLMVR